MTVLIPSLENMHGTLPSRVITGCGFTKTGGTEEGGRETHTERERRRGRARSVPRETVINLVNISHSRYLHYRGVSQAVTHARTHTHAQW